MAAKQKPKNKGKARAEGHGGNETTRLLFIDFCAVPEGLRKDALGIKTQKEFAKKYKISEVTLSEWRKEKSFWDEVWKKTQTFFRQRTGKVPAFILHGQGAEPAAGRDDNGSAACFGRIRKKRCQRRDSDVACEVTAVLFVPGLRVSGIRQRTRPDFDCAGLRRRGNRCHHVALRMRR